MLIPQDRLQERVSELGQEISQAYERKDLAVVAILKGSFIFAADLLRALTVMPTIDFMAISSYAGEPGSGVVRITKDLEENIAGRHVILIEDIIDTGLTANYLLRVLQPAQPRELRDLRPARQIRPPYHRPAHRSTGGSTSRTIS